MNQDNYSKGRWNRMKNYVELGLTLVIATFIFLFSNKDRLTSVFTMENFPVTQLSILLLFGTLMLISIWLHVAEGELQMFQDNFEEFVPPISWSYFGMTVFFAIILGLLGVFSYRIVIYSSIYVCFKISEIWGGWIRGSTLKAILAHARSNAPPEDIRRKRWDIIEKFEFEKPHLMLGVIVLSFSFVSLILGLLGEWLSSTIWLSSAYIIMLLGIIIAEWFLMRWRHKRDEALGEKYF
jgi:hypothetical protein